MTTAVGSGGGTKIEENTVPNQEEITVYKEPKSMKGMSEEELATSYPDAYYLFTITSVDSDIEEWLVYASTTGQDRKQFATVVRNHDGTRDLDFQYACFRDGIKRMRETMEMLPELARG